MANVIRRGMVVYKRSQHPHRPNARLLTLPQPKLQSQRTSDLRLLPAHEIEIEIAIEIEIGIPIGIGIGIDGKRDWAWSNRTQNVHKTATAPTLDCLHSHSPSFSQRVSEKARSIMRRLQAMVADPSDHCLNRGRGRGRNRDRFLFWLAPGLHGPLKLHCRVVSTPQ
jgi:hypothetical protein